MSITLNSLDLAVSENFLKLDDGMYRLEKAGEKLEAVNQQMARATQESEALIQKTQARFVFPGADNIQHAIQIHFPQVLQLAMEAQNLSAEEANEAAVEQANGLFAATVQEIADNLKFVCPAQKFIQTYGPKFVKIASLYQFAKNT